jgi:hypothetical protein
MSFYRWPPIAAQRTNIVDDTKDTMIQVATGTHLPYMSIGVNPQLMDQFYARAVDLWTNVMHTLWRAQLCTPPPTGDNGSLKQ